MIRLRRRKTLTLVDSIQFQRTRCQSIKATSSRHGMPITIGDLFPASRGLESSEWTGILAYFGVAMKGPGKNVKGHLRRLFRVLIYDPHVSRRPDINFLLMRSRVKGYLRRNRNYLS
ncbi:hypothetical protein PoB_003712400 [Plakobranchus ocellatus]|uniref:Uncharacterized protein n=1 Tax=Plakobranchus ocellatus TaxID=259542 RepID=A0AAV4AWV8_9GAST|nr:hypothetical protein PoB_003712400 [Plakobranchus ocellatus]